MHFAPALDRIYQTCIFLQGHTSAADRGFEPVQALASGVANDFVTGRGGRGGVKRMIACIYRKTCSAGYRDGGSAKYIPSSVLNNSMVAVFAKQENEEMQDCGRGDTFRFTSEFGPLEPEWLCSSPQKGPQQGICLVQRSSSFHDRVTSQPNKHASL